MRKFFIGCGVLVLLVLGAIGLLTWKLYPDFREFEQSATASLKRIEALDRVHPFDPDGQSSLDTERFATSLGVRLRLGESLAAAEQRLVDMQQRYEDDGDFGIFDLLGGMLGSFAGALDQFAQELEGAAMGWPEFAWHTRVLWGTLHRLDVLGLGDTALDPLRGEFLRFREHYEQLAQQHQQMPALRDQVEGLPPAVLASAEQVLAADLTRARASLRTIALDHVYMMPGSTLQELGSAGLETRESR